MVFAWLEHFKTIKKIWFMIKSTSHFDFKFKAGDLIVDHICFRSPSSPAETGVILEVGLDILGKPKYLVWWMESGIKALDDQFFIEDFYCKLSDNI